MITAAHAAGARLKQDFLALPKLEIKHKGGFADPFTAADLRAEETVRRILLDARPGYGFLGEECGLLSGRDSEFVWIVDALDGTINFLAGSPIFAVNIALARDWHVVAGVTYLPMWGETFWAEEGRGAWLNGRPIRVSPREGLARAVLSVGIPSAGKPRHAQFASEMARLTPLVSGIRRLGAGAVDMAYVACGRFDAYWEQCVSAWDMAAGAVLVREAGGVVSDTLGAPLNLRGGTVLASTPQLQRKLLAAIAPTELHDGR